MRFRSLFSNFADVRLQTYVPPSLYADFAAFNTVRGKKNMPYAFYGMFLNAETDFFS